MRFLNKISELLIISGVLLGMLLINVNKELLIILLIPGVFLVLNTIKRMISFCLKLAGETKMYIHILILHMFFILTTVYLYYGVVIDDFHYNNWEKGEQMFFNMFSLMILCFYLYLNSCFKNKYNYIKNRKNKD